MKQLALLVFLVPFLVVGQTKFQVVTIPAASKHTYWGTQSEPAIAINPKNTQEIAAASILAKTHRDEWMQKAAEKYPGYGWERNAGYPTLEHRKAVLCLGPTEIHRKTFRVELKEKA